MKYGYGLYHNAQEKQLLKEQACNNLKIKAYQLAEFACLLVIGMASLALMCSAYFGV